MAVLAPIESDVEKKVCEYAESKDCLHVKLTIWGRVGWPDRLFIHYGKILFIEFKRKGESPRAIQRWVGNLIRKHGFPVFTIDEVQLGKELIDSWIAKRITTLGP